MSNALEKHSQKASSKREVNIDTNFEKTIEAEEETAIMRTIENVNISRTLNFTFRQMIQQYHTLIHLIDLKVGFYGGFPGTSRVYSVGDLERFAKQYMNDKVRKREKNKELIEELVMNEYQYVYDYLGNYRPFVEKFKSERK